MEGSAISLNIISPSGPTRKSTREGREKNRCLILTAILMHLPSYSSSSWLHSSFLLPVSLSISPFPLFTSHLSFQILPSPHAFHPHLQFSSFLGSFMSFSTFSYVFIPSLSVFLISSCLIPNHTVSFSPPLLFLSVPISFFYFPLLLSFHPFQSLPPPKPLNRT